MRVLVVLSRNLCEHDAVIRVDLAQNGIRPQRWELEALARGATVNYDGKQFTYPVADEWIGFR